MGGDLTALEHLEVSRVDYCLFGNTNPFRVRIINRLNDNYDHFYVKKTDANRIYGLELEPGDDFFKDKLNDITFNQIRMAKEFVKFNERCFVRLLGDMRAYNYVINITPDIEGSRIKVGNRRVRDLLKIISEDEVSFPEKTAQLKRELNAHHETKRFDKCESMGDVLQAQLRLSLEKDFRQSLR